MFKTIEEKIKEKKEILKEIDSTLEISVNLYQTITQEYNNLYQVNRGKADGKHITGIANLLSKITDLYKTKNQIQNEIRDLEDLIEDEENNKSQENNISSKAGLLKILESNKNIKN